MSWIDTRTKEQKVNDEVWRRQGVSSERSAIIELLEDWRSGERWANLTIDQVIDLIEAGQHHE
jgi:hypothetical protein